jgi:uncharacterized protein YbjT (DUF2867 family)
MRVAITGGTGFVGGHLAVALSATGHEVVLVARGVDRRPWAREVEALAGVTLETTGIDDQEALTIAFAGCEAVAHCAGINREIGDSTYDAVHIRGTENVVRAAVRAGVRRLALVSFLRARPDCGSSYHESKWAAEEIVRGSDLEWTIIKPGMMFGQGDHMLDHLSRALRSFPVYVGVGPRTVTPLAVEDAVAVLQAALVDGRLRRATVPLMGPTQIDFDDAARLVARVIGRHPLFVRAPLPFHFLLAKAAERVMVVPLVSTAQVRILQEELIESTLAPDEVPDDLVPQTHFDESSIRTGLPEPRRFGLRDLRLPSDWHSQVTVCGEGTAVIERNPKDILEFVLDVNRYRSADRKIGRVRYVHRKGNTGQVRHDGRFLGIRAPAATLSFELTPYSRLEFRGASVPWPLKDFEGSFTCEESSHGTRVIHRECFVLGPMLGRVFRILLGGWLSRDTPAEVLRMKRILETKSPTTVARA